MHVDLAKNLGFCDFLVLSSTIKDNKYAYQPNLAVSGFQVKKKSNNILPKATQGLSNFHSLDIQTLKIALLGQCASRILITFNCVGQN